MVGFKSVVAVVGMLVLQLTSSVVLAATGLSVNGPKRIGVKTDRPFIYLVPATGPQGFRYSALGLPSGLSLDATTGIITGQSSNEGSHAVRLMVSDASGNSASKDVEFVVGQKAVGLTPVLGWNPWYVWGCAIDDAKMRQAADLLVSTGLAAHGFNYINLDDCWQGKRNANGEMVPNARFPDMKALGDYIHSKGLRFGIYTSPGDKTCGGYEGTRDHNPETGVSFLAKDVDLYASWGMDFIKYDYCIFPKEKAAQAHYHQKQPEMYRRMSAALDKSSRAVVHMICQYGENNLYKWATAVGGNMWRTNHDLADDWQAILRNGFANVKLTQVASPGHFNDLDMLMVGKANWPRKLGEYTIPNTPPRPTKLTFEEQRTHMSLWSLMASPLLFSGDLSQMDPVTKQLLTNDEVLDVNQDGLAAPVTQVRDAKGFKILTRRLADNTLAVGIFNLNNVRSEVVVSYKELGVPMSANGVTVRDLWKHSEFISKNPALKGGVAPHGVIFLKLTPR